MRGSPYFKENVNFLYFLICQLRKTLILTYMQKGFKSFNPFLT